MKSKRIQLSLRRGWRMPPNTIKVDRSTLLGNPFIVGIHGTRVRCVQSFRYLCVGYLCISADNPDAQKAFRRHARANLRQLRGKNLVCRCPLNAPCHADILLEVANA